MNRWLKWLLPVPLIIASGLAWQIWRDSHPLAFSLGAPLLETKVRPQILSGGKVAVLLAPDGTLWVWGEDKSLPNGRTAIPVRLGDASDWIDIAGSWDFMLARKADGSMWSWKPHGAIPNLHAGLTAFAPQRIGTDTDWRFIATTGFDGGWAIRRSGSVWAWGRYDNDTGFDPMPAQFGNEPDAAAIGADIVSRYVLRRDGSIWSRDPRHASDGTIKMQQTQLSSERDWAAISAHHQLLALKTDGSVWVGGGAASFNAVPEGSSLATAPFKQLGEDRDWTEIRDSSNCCFARKRDGSWWAMGENLDGRLGFAPYGRNWNIELEKMPFTFDPWALGVGGTTTLMLARDGSLWSWGKKLGSPPPSAKSKGFRTFANRWVGQLPLRPKPFPDPGAVWDNRPHKIWQWKAETH
jgi:alpha-tubulin suppressor-like RCC1 family protein